MFEDIISVIVPIYNTALYLDKCIKSIVEQTYKNIEIILIDDGSTDESIDICRRYEVSDDRIKIIHQSKKGVAFARNNGIDYSSGKYITFVDSDDYIEKNMIEKMYNTLKENNSDIVICGRKVIDESGNIYDSKKLYEEYNMDGIEGLKQMLDEKLFYCVSWGKLYKSTLFDNYKYNINTKICEDLELLYKIFLTCNIITYIPDELYVWLSRKNSITKQKFNDSWRKEILICEEIIKYTQNNCKEIEQYAIKRYIRANISCLQRIDSNEFDKDFEELKNNIKKYKLKNKKILKIRLRIFIFVITHVPYIAKIYLKNRCK